MALSNNPNTTTYQLEEVVITPAENPFSIDRFVAKTAKTGGFAKSNKFRVLFGVEDVDFFCESAELPGRTLSTSDSRIYGPIYKTPYETQYPEINLMFLCDQQMSQKLFFDKWLDKINPNANKMGRDFDVEYRDNYVQDVEIQQLSEKASVTYAVKLYNAFPTSVAALQTNWADDQFHKLQVTLAYDYWVNVDQAEGSPGIPIGDSPESFPQLDTLSPTDSYLKGLSSPASQIGLMNPLTTTKLF